MYVCMYHSIFLPRDFYKAIMVAIIEIFPFHQLQSGKKTLKFTTRAVKFISRILRGMVCSSDTSGCQIKTKVTVTRTIEPT